MGIFTTDTFTLDSNVTVTASNCYISLGESTVEVSKSRTVSGQHTVRGGFLYWNTKEDKTIGTPSFRDNWIEVTATDIANTSVYTVLYDGLKQQLTNYTDDI